MQQARKSNDEVNGMPTGKPSVRDRLIEEGLIELNLYGINDFSVRRIAAACGVSCAAPYKHFANKNEFIAAIIEYGNSLWGIRQRRVIAEHPGSTHEQLLFLCRDYILFLVENPYFRSVLMSKDKSFDAEYLKLKSRLSETTYRLVIRYCNEVNMPENVSRIKLFVVRSLLYGAAMMIDNGEMPNTPEILDEIVAMIDREFHLPWE